jgi:DNA replication protein DnaC
MNHQEEDPPHPQDPTQTPSASPNIFSGAKKPATPQEIDAWLAKEKAAHGATCFAHSGVPARYASSGQLNKLLEHQGWRDCFRDLLALATQKHTGKIIVLSGPRGCGKTLMGIEALRACSLQHCFFSSYATLEDYTRGLRGQDVDWQAVQEKFEDPKILFLDEIAKAGDSPWEERQLFHLVNRRFGDLKHTILAAATESLDLSLCLSPSILDRIHEDGAILQLNWPGFRPTT